MNCLTKCLGTTLIIYGFKEVFLILMCLID